MNNHKALAIMGGLGLVLIVTSFFMMSNYPEKFGYCSNELIPGFINSDGRVSLSSKPDNYCEDMFVGYVGTFMVGGLMLCLCSVLLFFAKQSTYYAWKRFAIYSVAPIIFLLGVLPGKDTSSGFGPTVEFDRTMMAIMLSTIFIFSTLFIIIRGHFRKS